MAVFANGREYAFITDDFFVEGTKVTEAWCNGVKVYPDVGKHLCMEIGGSAAMSFDAGFRFVDNAITNPKDRIVATTTTISVNVSAKILVESTSTTKRPSWELVEGPNPPSQSDYNVETRLDWFPGKAILFHGARKFILLNSRVFITATPIHYTGEIRGTDWAEGSSSAAAGVISTYMPLGIINGMNGVYEGNAPTESKTIMSANVSDKIKSVPYRMHEGSYEPNGAISSEYWYTDNKRGDIQLNGFRTVVREIFEERRLYINSYGPSETSYRVVSRAFSHYVRPDSIKEVPWEEEDAGS
jgi:hypothetical protein